LLLGLYQWDEEMNVFIEINISSTYKHWKKVDKFLKSIGWECDEDGQGNPLWYNERRLSTFMVDNVFKEEVASDFLMIELQKIQKIKDWGRL